MDMSNVVAVTNRWLLPDNKADDKEALLMQIERLAKSNIRFIILREKDLSENEYEKLAIKAIDICKTYNKCLVLHTYVNVALRLNHPYIHLPFPILLKYDKDYFSSFKITGVSIHSKEEAEKAENWGATYITAGHIYATDCKKDVPPRGIEWLENITASVSIPVYAIGGINNEDNINSILSAGAAGGCMMSYAMSKFYIDS